MLTFMEVIVLGLVFPRQARKCPEHYIQKFADLTP